MHLAHRRSRRPITGRMRVCTRVSEGGAALCSPTTSMTSVLVARIETAFAGEGDGRASAGPNAIVRSHDKTQTPDDRDVAKALAIIPEPPRAKAIVPTGLPALSTATAEATGPRCKLLEFALTRSYRLLPGQPRLEETSRPGSTAVANPPRSRYLRDRRFVPPLALLY
jgi:hypothetical protein